MSVLVVADLHLDFWLQGGRCPLAMADPDVLSSLDALIIAGDLSNKPKVRWHKMISHLSRYIAADRIHVLPGNHDYYDHALDGEGRLSAICAEAGARFLQKTEIVFGTNRFLCCTLWSDFALHGDTAKAMAGAQRDINDYRYIRHIGSGYRRIWPSDTALIHADHLQWLELRLAAPFSGRTIIVTHHCPHPDLIGERSAELDPVYGSNLLPLIERYQPHTWLFGHTHYRQEALVGRTRVRNVSLGYPWQVQSGREGEILLRGLVDLVDTEVGNSVVSDGQRDDYSEVYPSKPSTEASSRRSQAIKRLAMLEEQRRLINEKLQRDLAALEKVDPHLAASLRKR